MEKKAYYESRTSDLSCWNDEDQKRALQFPAHLHPHIELVYFLEGEVTAYADSVAYSLRPGDIFVVFPNQVHHYETRAAERFFLLIVNPEWIPELATVWTSALPVSSLLRGEENLKLFALFQVIHQEYSRSGTYHEAILKGYLLALFGRLLQRMTLEKPRAGQSPTLKLVLDYCAEHSADALSLGTLSEKLHLSKYYISHLFGTKLRIHFNDYINSLRVSHACRELRQTDQSITEIAEGVGFHSLRTFNRAFVKQMGVTPGSYRKARIADAQN